MAVRKKISLLIFLGFVFSGCATVNENITSDPAGAVIYWGKTEKEIKPTIYKTPFHKTISSSGIESWCYQLKLSSYHDSEIICKPSHPDDRNIHFVLTPVASETKQSAAALAALSLTKKTIQVQTDSVVFVEMYDHKGNSLQSGSGFFISEDGIIATNYHIIEKGFTAKIKTSKGKTYDDVFLLSYHAARDIALLKINEMDTPAVRLGNSDTMKQGDTVITIETPEGSQIATPERKISEIREEAGIKIFRFGDKMSAGSSGGPIFDMNGEVVGIAVLLSAGNQQQIVGLPVKELVPLQRQMAPISISERYFQQLGTRSSDVDQAVLFYLKKGDLETSWKYLKTLNLSLLSDSDLDRRIELYEKYLSQNNFYAYMAAGYTCYEASKFQKAIHYFETALRLNKNEFDQYFKLGMSYKNIEKHEEAIVNLENALRADPNHYGANFELGMIYGYPMLKANIYNVKTDYDRSIELLQTARKIKPAEADVYYQLGSVYFQKEQYLSALKETQSAIKLREESKYFRQNGEIYEKLNDFDTALLNYRKALALEESFKARYFIIDTLIRLKKYDETIDFTNKTLGIYPSVSWLYNKIGDAYSEKGDYWAAIENYKKCLQKEPANYEAHFSIALSFLRLKKWDDSAYWWKKAIEVNPNESASFFNLGLVYYSKSQFHNAKNSFEKYLVANPDDEDAKLWLENCRQQIEKNP